MPIVFDEILKQFEFPGMLYQLEYLLRIVIAAACGLVIGHERTSRNKPAGIRTHSIVALGSALIMIVSKYGFNDVPGYDAARVAAQVVSGVGFLGAGVIFVRNNLVNGLTTAAGVWATAGVGLAFGAGLYILGIASTLLLVLLQMIMHRVAFLSKAAYNGSLKMTVVQKAGVVKEVEALLNGAKVEIVSVKINKSKKESIKVEYEVIYPPGFHRSVLLSQLAENGQILTVSE